MLFFIDSKGYSTSQKLHKHFVHCFQQKTRILQCISSILNKSMKEEMMMKKLIMTLFIAMLALAGCNTNKEEPKKNRN